MNITQDVVKYFESRNRPVKEIIARGIQRGLTEGQIVQGLQNVYDRLQSGEALKPIQIVWAIWAEAKRSKSYEYVVDQERINTLLKYNANLRDMVKKSRRFYGEVIALIILIEILAGIIIYWGPI